MDTIAFAVRRKDIRHERAHKKSEGQAGQGVSSGVKGRAAKDGKKDRRGWGPVRRLDGTEEVVLSRAQRSTKEALYAVRRGKEWIGIFDPEKSLHVGRHNKKAGVVYRFKRLVWNGDPREYYPSGERGILRWDGKGGARGLQEAAATFALARAAQKATRPALEAMLKPGAWGSAEFWEDMARRCGLAEDILAVQEVMES